MSPPIRSALIDEFAELYPCLYHMAHSGSWASISRHGLLSTSALLDLFEVPGPQRVALESRWRPKSKTISHPVHGSAVIRDQRPMPPDSLQSVLVGTTPEEWYGFLNQKVFMWVNRVRLAKMLKAEPYRDRPHDVLTIGTRALLEEYFDEAKVCRLNSGAVRAKQGFRSPASFQSVWDRKVTCGLRGLAELTIDYAVPDISRFVLSVHSQQGGEVGKLVWRP